MTILVVVSLNLCAKGCIYEEIFREADKVWFEVSHYIGVRVGGGCAERFLTDNDSEFHEIIFSFYQILCKRNFTRSRFLGQSKFFIILKLVI